MFNFKIILSDFHGGGLVSRHKTADAALATYSRLQRSTDCVCGCYTVLGTTPAAEKALKSATDPRTGNPYFYD